MAKRKTNDKLVGFVIFCLGLLATLTIFLSALYKGSDDNKTYYTGLEVAFGKSGLDWGTLVKAYIPFNILATLAYILPVIGGVLMLLAGKKDMLLKVLACVMFLGAAVLLFLLPQYIKVVTESGLVGSKSTANLGGSLAYGAIIGASLSILGCLGSAYKIVK